jgi:hypothetical protein
MRISNYYFKVSLVGIQAVYNYQVSFFLIRLEYYSNRIV